VAGVSDIVPYVGPFAGGIPAALVALVSNGWQNAAIVVAAFVAINQIEAHLLGPRIVARSVKLTPLTVIFALLVGAKVFGWIGLIISVPVAGALRVVLEHVLPKYPVSRDELQAGLSYEPKRDAEAEAGVTPPAQPRP
jgi:predicted PurR-regulated permease PerM